jgi:hypothetical protein
MAGTRARPAGGAARALHTEAALALLFLLKSGWHSQGELDKDKLHEAMAHPIELGEALEPGAA